jgi:hypothetical protein
LGGYCPPTQPYPNLFTKPLAGFVKPRAGKVQVGPFFPSRELDPCEGKKKKAPGEGCAFLRGFATGRGAKQPVEYCYNFLSTAATRYPPIFFTTRSSPQHTEKAKAKMSTVKSGANNPRAVNILVFSVDGQLVNEFSTLTEAALWLNTSVTFDQVKVDI